MEDRGEIAERTEGQVQFQRFAELASLIFKTSPEQDIKNPRDRVTFIKNTDPTKFFEILGTAESLLSAGEFRDKESRGYVKGVGYGVESNEGNLLLDPPEQAEIELERFYEQMREQVSPETLPVWSAKLFNAIVIAHLFVDGNGRLARNFYSLLRAGKVLDQQLSVNRPPGIAEYSKGMYRNAVVRVLQKDGVTSESNPATVESQFFASGMDYPGRGPVGSLRYDAAKRVLEKKGQYDPKQGYINARSWMGEDRKEYQKAYADVRQEAFWEGINGVDLNPQLAVGTLDRILKIPAQSTETSRV